MRPASNKLAMIAAMFALIVAGSLFSPAPLRAQTGVAVAGGPVFPVGDFSSAVAPGLHAGLIAQLRVPLIPIAIGGELMGYYMPGSGDRPNMTQIAASFDGRFGVLPLPLLSPYAIGGIGIYGSSHDVDPEADRSFSWDPGISIGAGLGIDLVVERLFLEARYHYVFSSPARTFVPVSIGIYF